MTSAPDGSRMRLLFQIRENNYDAAAVAFFLYHLCHVVKGRILLVWDRAPIHRGDPVKEFLRKHPGRIHIEPLPGYAPDLNPVEAVWGHTKYGDLANFTPHDLTELKNAAAGSLHRKRRKPRLLRSFFAQAGLEI